VSPQSWAVVLTGRDEQPAVLRPGVLAFPLDTRVANRPALVGPEVTVTANLLNLLPVNPSVVIVVNPGVVVAPVVDEVIRIVYSLLDPAGGTRAALTVAVASPRLEPPGTAGRTCLFNTAFEAMPEALVESVAAARRIGLLTRQGGCVLILQRFAAATASAVVHATPDPRHEVRISARWGITEVNDLAADEFTVRGGTVVQTLAYKPTASVTASGGTRTVVLPAQRHYRYALPRDVVLRMAIAAKDAAIFAAVPLSLDIALVAGEPVVIRCRPCTSGH
jgi:hypothetical protein